MHRLRYECRRSKLARTIARSVSAGLVTVCLLIGCQTLLASPPVGQKIWLKASNGRFVSADLNRGESAPLIADRETVSTWEQFEVGDAGGKFISLRSLATGLFVSADAGRGANAPLVADHSTVGKSERFKWIEMADGYIALRCKRPANVVRIDLGAAGAPLVCDAADIGPAALFSWGAAGSQPPTRQSVAVFLTTGDRANLLASQPALTFGPDSGDGLVIDVNDSVALQQVEGFGAALTDSSAWLIYNRLTAAQRDSLMESLFSPSKGIGISLLRVPMGASDFALSHYTYDDVAAGQSDADLAMFSIDHDRSYIIPLLNQALALNPNLKVIASPWSAPAWMKNSGSLIGGKLLPQYYGSYAKYFVRFVQAYQTAGIPVFAVTPQNEPFFEPSNYPGMRWEAAEVAAFIKNNLGPEFAAAGLNTRIVIWDHNWDVPAYPIAVLNDSAAKAFIDGSAFHCYAGTVDAQTAVHNAHPDRRIYFTECTSGTWSPNWSDNFTWDLKNILTLVFRNWGVSALKWNIALDQNSGPHTGGCDNCTGIVTVNQGSGAVAYNHDYYSIGHFSKFVTPGATRIESTQVEGKGLYGVAFKNPDASKVLVVVNSSQVSRTFRIRWGGQSAAYTLPASSGATFKW